MTTAKTKMPRSFSTILGYPQQKKYVVRYDAVTEEGGIMRSAYLDKALLAELGNPESVKITVEAAE